MRNKTTRILLLAVIIAGTILAVIFRETLKVIALSQSAVQELMKIDVRSGARRYGIPITFKSNHNGDTL